MGPFETKTVPDIFQSTKVNVHKNTSKVNKMHESILGQLH